MTGNPVRETSTRRLHPRGCWLWGGRDQGGASEWGACPESPAPPGPAQHSQVPPASSLRAPICKMGPGVHRVHFVILPLLNFCLSGWPCPAGALLEEWFRVWDSESEMWAVIPALYCWVIRGQGPSLTPSTLGVLVSNESIHLRAMYLMEQFGKSG